MRSTRLPGRLSPSGGVPGTAHGSDTFQRCLSVAVTVRGRSQPALTHSAAIWATSAGGGGGGGAVGVGACPARAAAAAAAVVVTVTALPGDGHYHTAERSDPGGPDSHPPQAAGAGTAPTSRATGTGTAAEAGARRRRPEPARAEAAAVGAETAPCDRSWMHAAAARRRPDAARRRPRHTATGRHVMGQVTTDATRRDETRRDETNSGVHLR